MITRLPPWYFRLFHYLLFQLSLFTDAWLFISFHYFSRCLDYYHYAIDIIEAFIAAALFIDIIDYIFRALFIAADLFLMLYFIIDDIAIIFHLMLRLFTPLLPLHYFSLILLFSLRHISPFDTYFIYDALLHWLFSLLFSRDIAFIIFILIIVFDWAFHYFLRYFLIIIFFHYYFIGFRYADIDVISPWLPMLFIDISSSYFAIISPLLMPFSFDIADYLFLPLLMLIDFRSMLRWLSAAVYFFFRHYLLFISFIDAVFFHIIIFFMILIILLSLLIYLPLFHLLSFFIACFHLLISAFHWCHFSFHIAFLPLLISFRCYFDDLLFDDYFATLLFRHDTPLFILRFRDSWLFFSAFAYFHYISRQIIAAFFLSFFIAIFAIRYLMPLSDDFFDIDCCIISLLFSLFILLIFSHYYYLFRWYYFMHIFSLFDADYWYYYYWFAWLF